LYSLRRRLIAGLEKSISDIRVNGHPTAMLPHILSITIDGVDNTKLMASLDAEGICVSGAACGSNDDEPSHVLLALGMTTAAALNTIRLSLGKWNSDDDIEYVVKVISRLVVEIRVK
jgi:cysteine desulfurase